MLGVGTGALSAPELLPGALIVSAGIAGLRGAMFVYSRIMAVIGRTSDGRSSHQEAFENLNLASLFSEVLQIFLTAPSRWAFAMDGFPSKVMWLQNELHLVDVMDSSGYRRLRRAGRYLR
ncbi:hypothetical protein SAMN04488693_1164 [Arthrobacter subterraneus]|uniref:Uncharacterized protein n=1 Tax=Arthrobacter subterraneus TaxID=335973 RepID=A0A1G8M1V7_9MICC|nr:hypothetical protein SAMN04488693_1164 [Arthrobacter subterraneus]